VVLPEPVLVAVGAVARLAVLGATVGAGVITFAVLTGVMLMAVGSHCGDGFVTLLYGAK
jgi:hypothetical protein